MAAGGPQTDGRAARPRLNTYDKFKESDMPKLDERISNLETKLKQLKVRQQRLEARARALASRQARKDDTRRKILIGATVLARIDRGELDQKTLHAWLNAHLTRADDRALFDLPLRDST